MEPIISEVGHNRRIIKYAEYEARIRELEAALQEAIDYIRNQADVVDGPDGPEPDEAMSLATHLTWVLKR